MVYHGYNTLSYYTDEQLLEKIKKVYSIAGLLRELELKPVGGNYKTIRKLLNRLKPDTSHWTGQGWSIGLKHKENIDYSRANSLKQHIVDARGHRCESCKLEKWLEIPITLELEHIDGDGTNNEDENLRLLCPNCHSQTKTWRRRKSVFN